ncbi:ArsR/SmtB family transcription factor [Promicromonospora iranensis]|uniref:ArsR family transcriptional regulator n=1 Tax=Promicromonospora iranensis TaxID=1105144 RepID=A0ABU2CIH0_9MICO|nr:metalloregulator ArsR/SmtB family transcription factor [Promicromonospora iranensis]MDR7381132.1 ArsR family transcriptional regulator [Promicromonospora iranensis]
MPSAVRPPTAELAAQFALLSDPLRLQIVLALTEEQLCTCHLVDLTGAKQTTVSHHLRQLRDAGVVAGEAEGRFTWYRLTSDAFAAMLEALTGIGSVEDAPRLRPTCVG